MIQNTLQPNELKRILQPFLQLADPGSTIQILSNVLGIPIIKREDVVCQTKILLMYKGYQVDIRDLRPLKDTGLAVCIQFKAKKKWYHGLFKDQNGEIIQDLQSICEAEIDDLSFRRFTTTGYVDQGRQRDDVVFIHDSRAFNKNWSKGRDISPLLLAPDAHDGNCFVEFQFNPAGYIRQDGHTVLRQDWIGNASLVSEEIERSVRRMLEMEPNNER